MHHGFGGGGGGGGGGGDDVFDDDGFDEGDGEVTEGEERHTHHLIFVNPNPPIEGAFLLPPPFCFEKPSWPLLILCLPAPAIQIMDTVAHQAIMKQMVEEFWQQQKRDMYNLEISTEQVCVARAPACVRASLPAAWRPILLRICRHRSFGTTTTYRWRASSAS